jgi:hypothetical protein
VCVNVPAGVPLGTELLATATVDVASGEIEVANNTDDDRETVVGSIDPNAKFVDPAGCGPNKAIEGTERLTYTIFFENKPEATAEAIYVLVLDTLDPDLDWGTLQVGPTSHDDELTFGFDPLTGELMWFFDNINLPPNVTPPEGEGFVSYTITPQEGLSPGTTISNRAAIRFDFNEWLEAPDTGPLALTVGPCCLACDCFADPVCDAVVNVFDVVIAVDVAFRAGTPVVDPNPACPREDTDVTCDNVTNVFDVVKFVDVAFRAGNPAVVFCDPCS